MAKLALLCSLLVGAVINSFSQTLPTGFSRSLVTTGISNPTAMAVAPDGRIFICQQNGQLKIVQNGTLLATPFVSLTVNSSGERGLIGIAFDPNFTTNNYIYLYYTLSSAANNRISRFTANGNVVVPGSELVVLDLDPLSTATNHNGGCLKFGLDGSLYIAVGENANTSWAQNLDSYHGKILRINPDGSVPTGNPFTTGTNQRRRVWSYGMRNPFSMEIEPVTGKLFVNDVGQGTWEEINNATSAGLNFGWPNAEGNSTNGSYTNPWYTYQHGSGNFSGCAITGGTFFNPASTNYPSQYTNKYYFLEYCNSWINFVNTSGSASVQNFGSSMGGSLVAMITGIDGNLYYLSRGSSALYKIVYNNAAAPSITNQPQNLTINVGQTATFSVTSSGTAPLSYQWRKNGTNISGATSSVYTKTNSTAGDAGTYSVVVSNVAGSTTSNNATLTVNAPNSLPTANITSPTNGTLYRGGDIISFTGNANDPEDGTLSASAFSWVVIFHHDIHTHPGPSAPQSVTSGTFTIPNSGETATNVFYRLYCIVHDSQGAIDSSYIDLVPRVSNITINTVPTGLLTTIDGQPQTSPYTTPSVEGIIRSVGVLSPQTLGGTSYTFSNWTNGGGQTQTFGTPINDTYFTANFNSVLSNITTQSLASSSICAGSALSVSFSANGSANAGNDFTAQLSNASGSFSSPVSIGTLTSTTVGIISCTIPIGTAGGTGYRIRVVSSNPSITGSDNGANLTISGSIGAAGPITGPAVVCAGDRNVIYKVSTITNATSYIWTLPPGTSIILGANTKQIEVDFSATGASSGDVKVYGTNASCIGASYSLNVSVNQLTPVSFTGLAPKYNTTSPTATLTGTPSGGTFSGPGISGNSFIPSMAGIGGPHTIAYSHTNASGCVSTITQGVCVVPNMPGLISGEAKPCPGATGLVYSVPPVAGALYYTWTVPAGVTITGGTTGNSIIVTISSSFVTGRIYVAANISCGASDQRYLDIARNILVAPASVSGNASGVCLSTQSYTSAPVSGAQSYTWAAPSGANIISGQGTSSATVTYTSAFTTGNLCVTANNSCGASNQRCIAIKKTPPTPVSISGPLSVCANQTNNTYTVNPTYGATGYSWTVPIGSTITSGQGTGTITMNYGSTTGRVGVTAINACGPSGSLMIPIAMPCRLGNFSRDESSEMLFPILPNPCSDYFVTSKGASVKIFDLSGRSVFVKKLQADETRVDVPELINGVYIVELHVEGITQRQKLAVKK